MLDLSTDAYMFAQALDNSGEPEYWIIRQCGTQFDKLEATDRRLRLVRAKIDETLALQRQPTHPSRELECQATLSGIGVITVRPTTLDVHGRISPVLMLLNVYSDMRHHAAVTLRAIPRVTGRELSQNAAKEIEKVQRTLNWPRLFLFLRLFFTKTRSFN